LPHSRFSATAGRAPRRALGVVLTGMFVAALAVVSAAGASNPKGVPVPSGAGDSIKPTQLPVGVANAPVSYILQLSGDPVVLVDAKSQERGRGGLSAAEKAQMKQQLQQQQAPVVQAAQQVGATVKATFQSVYNGVAVTIPARDAWKLSTIKGVTAVYRGRTYTRSDFADNGLSWIGAPAAWDGVDGVHGEGMKIGDIDTGIDYTHADFGGSGNPADYTAALATDTLPANPAWFGSSAPKVKGGTDLVGDDYNASDPNHDVPQPDPNPLDCNSHGTHTGGTLAGFGVLADGSRYDGPYNASTIDDNSFAVPPGVAPLADLYSIRVFGCNGSVSDDVLMQAMEWAVDNGMDAINMSLGAPFGSADDPDAQAANNTARDGIIVGISSGNNGNSPYITGSPGTSPRAITAAAVDPNPSFPAANLTLTKADGSDGGTITAIDANGFSPLPPGPFSIKVIQSSPGVISLGCSVDDDGGPNSLPPDTFIVVARGTCARVAKAIYGQQAGAAGVIMVNNSTAYPPFEGKITSNPDTGDQFTVTIPFLGTQGGSNPSTSDQGKQFLAADGGTLTETETTIANPGYSALAGFSSFGPSAEGSLKPDVSAPGVSIVSAGMGTGTGPLIDSGTSMAAPHTTGLAVLVKQAHPKWKRVAYWKAAVVNTSSAAKVNGFPIRGAGAGGIQSLQAVDTQVVANGDPDGTASLSFGVPEVTSDFSATEHITLHNFGSSPATFNVADSNDQGAAHTIVLGTSQVTVPAKGTADVSVQLNVSLANSADPATSFSDWYGNGTFDDVGGIVAFTPASDDDNGGIPLAVPYYAVPTAVSNVAVKGTDGKKLTIRKATATAVVTNNGGGATGYADWLALGGTSSKLADSDSADLLAAGIQSFPTSNLLLFGLQVAHPWTNPAENEYDIYVDVNNDGNPDYVVASVDFGGLTAGSANGEDVVAVITLATGQASIRYLTGAYFNGATMELPVDFDQLCRSGQPCISDSTPITYQVFSFSRNGGADAMTDIAPFNVFKPVFSNNFEDVVAPGGSVNDTITIDKDAWHATPQAGLLVLAQNNQASRNNHDEAFTINVKLK
jgi:minor extracellular serine protease Vpr